KLAVEDLPFYINSETRPWLPPADGSPRRAAVSAFGFGGTNFHFVLEEYTPEAKGTFRLKHVDHVSLIHAESQQALQSQCESLLVELKDSKNLLRYQNFVDKTKLDAIADNHARVAFVSKNTD